MDTIGHRKKVLFIIKLPPPITGATLSNKRIFESEKIKEVFNTKFIAVSYASSVANLGKLNIKKFLKYLNTLMKTVFSLISFQPNIIYFQISPLGTSFLRDALIVLVIKLINKKIILHLRGLGIEQAIAKKKWLKKVYKKVFKNTVVFCFSDNVKSDFANIHNGPVYTVPNGLQPGLGTNNFSPKRNYTQILYLSHYLEQKGIIDIINIAEILKLYNKKFALKLVGTETVEFSIEELRRIIIEKNLQNEIEVMGPKYNEDKKKLLSESGIFVFPTKNEGFGNVALEAMEAMMPVVAYNEGSLPSIVKHNETGYIVEKNNKEDFAEKLIQLLDDENRIKDMGKKGRSRFLSHYTIQSFENRMVEVINKSINNYSNATK